MSGLPGATDQRLWAPICSFSSLMKLTPVATICSCPRLHAFPDRDAEPARTRGTCIACRAESPLLNSVGEIVGFAAGAAGTERHLAESPGKLASAAGDREHRVATVEERPLDGQLALLQGERPETLPRLTRHGAKADSLVGA